MPSVDLEKIEQEIINIHSEVTHRGQEALNKTFSDTLVRHIRMSLQKLLVHYRQKLIVKSCQRRSSCKFFRVRQVFCYDI